jgi:hypothetical protein
MTDPRPDPLLDKLRDLPDPELPRAVHDRIRRRASAEFVEYGRGPTWYLEAGRIWSTFGVPAVLVACGLLYLAEGWATIHRIYGPDADAHATAAAHVDEPRVLVALRDER